jgi:hypothetical protein
VKKTCLIEISKLSKIFSNTFYMHFSAQVLIHLLVYNPYESLKLQTLMLLSSLSNSSYAVLNWFCDNKDVIKICETYLYHTNENFILLALEILINFCRYSEVQPKDYHAEIEDSFCLLLKSNLNSKSLVRRIHWI